VLDILAEEQLPARAAHLGEHLETRLRSWTRFRRLRDVRGAGLLWGIELATREAAKRWTEEARRRGVLLLAGGPEGRVAQLVPPLTVAEPQLTAALDLLEAALASSAETLAR